MPMIARLKLPETRRRIAEDIARDGLNNWGRIKSWDDVRISITPNLPQFAGRTIGALAAERGQDPIDTVCDYLIDDKAATRVLVTSISEDDVRELMRAARAAGRLGRQLRGDLRHGLAGHAASALLRHVSARARSLLPAGRADAAGDWRSAR